MCSIAIPKENSESVIRFTLVALAQHKISFFHQLRWTTARLPKARRGKRAVIGREEPRQRGPGHVRDPIRLIAGLLFLPFFLAIKLACLLLDVGPLSHGGHFVPRDHRCPKLMLRGCDVNKLSYKRVSRCRVTSNG